MFCLLASFMLAYESVKSCKETKSLYKTQNCCTNPLKTFSEFKPGFKEALERLADETVSDDFHFQWPFSDYIYTKASPYFSAIVERGGERIEVHRGQDFLGNDLQGDEIFSMFSTSKVMTNVVALKLVQMGLIENINDPLAKYLPELRDENDEYQTFQVARKVSRQADGEFPTSYQESGNTYPVEIFTHLGHTLAVALVPAAQHPTLLNAMTFTCGSKNNFRTNSTDSYSGKKFFMQDFPHEAYISYKVDKAPTSCKNFQFFESCGNNTMKERYESFLRTPVLMHQPGEMWDYGGCSIWVARVIEAVYSNFKKRETTFAKAFEEILTVPVGMTNTILDNSEFNLDPTIGWLINSEPSDTFSNGYSPDEVTQDVAKLINPLLSEEDEFAEWSNAIRVATQYLKVYTGDPNAAGLTTMNDLAKFTSLIQTGKTPSGVEFFNEDTMKLALNPPVKTSSLVEFGLAQTSDAAIKSDDVRTFGCWPSIVDKWTLFGGNYSTMIQSPIYSRQYKRITSSYGWGGVSGNGFLVKSAKNVSAVYGTLGGAPSVVALGYKIEELIDEFTA